MKISKTMLINWLLALAAAVSLPEVVTLIPVETMPYILAGAAVAKLFCSWWDQQFGVIGLLAVAGLVVGILSAPAFVAVLPPVWAQVAAMIVSGLSLITRANQAQPSLVGLLVQPPR